jgi:hypothetical protein
VRHDVVGAQPERRSAAREFASRAGTLEPSLLGRRSGPTGRSRSPTVTGSPAQPSRRTRHGRRPRSPPRAPMSCATPPEVHRRGTGGRTSGCRTGAGSGSSLVGSSTG